jgi:aminopeptidase N
VDTNLTRAEAMARADLICVDSYRIAVDLRDAATGSATFGSETTVLFTCHRPGAGTWIDLIADEVVSAELNGRALDVGGRCGARLPLPDLAAENELVVRARCRYMTTGEGLHRLVDPADGAVYLYTQFATADARRVFACFEQPDLKARYAWEVTAPADWQVVSNSPTPAPIEEAPGLARWQFAETPPLSTYLAALCAGPFHVVRGEHPGPHGTYPLGLFVRASVAQHVDSQEILAITRAGLAHYEREFEVPFPFVKYDQVAIPEFNLGAMENPGVVTFREDLAVFRSRVTDAARERRAMVILHEMAHMWFGDLVTMRWWDDLWLNESFATWAGYRVAALATRFDSAPTSFALSQKAWAYRQDELPSTHPIVADMVDLEAVYLNFDGITYAKGASVLTQLVAFVGLEPFLAGVNRYFRAHAWGSATLADLLAELSATSGRDLAAWADVWLAQPGVTSLLPVIESGADGRYTRVAVEQHPATRPAGVSQALRPHRVAIGLYRWQGSPGHRRLVRTERAEIDLFGARAEVPDLVGVPAADLVLVNDDDLTYAKTRLDPVSRVTALAGVGAIGDSLPRALAWGALWEEVRSAELPAQQFVDVALAGLVDEQNPDILEWVSRWMRQAVTTYVAPELRAAVALRMCAGTAALLEGAEPGSQVQLALATAHISAATDPDRLDRLAELLAGHDAIPGLVLDDDLRWAIVVRLVAQGAAQGSLIEDELATDRTSEGARAAAQARAAIPTEAAKDAAWEAAVAVGGLPNALLEATVRGFSDPDAPADLLAPYRSRYFEDIAGLFADRSPAEAKVLATGLFPPASEQAVAGARALLADPALPAGLRRILAEQSAEADRALACWAASREYPQG